MRAKRKGTTLVELMVATVFLGICASAILSVTTFGQQQATLAQERLTALAIAETEIATYRSTARTTALTTGSTFVTRPEAVMRGADVKIARAVTKVATYTDLYQVDISVSWDDTIGKGHQRKVRLVTLVRAPYG